MRHNHAFLAMITALLLSACSHDARDKPSAKQGDARSLTAKDAAFYLRSAAREGETELVAGLLAAGAPPNEVDERGYSALTLAAYHGHLSSVEALLKGGANACLGDSRGNTALMGAAFKGYEKVVGRLAKEKCQIDQQNAQGRTALMFASLVGKTGIVQLLSRAGADANTTDHEGLDAKAWQQTQQLGAVGARP